MPTLLFRSVTAVALWWSIFSSLYFASCASMTPTAQAPIVTLPNGLQVQGVTDGSTDSFLGIPFAQPPVGSLRWTPPVEPSRWTGVFQATKFGNTCMQFSLLAAPSPHSSYSSHFSSPTTAYSEDCLYLNVFSRVNASSSPSPLPVMVWIYGGAYVSGSSTSYPANNLVLAGTQEVIVVTLNYRLSSFGFFALPGLLGQEGVNYGLMDQQFAMKWVQDNIKAFGGDPSRVTVFGESAGAGSTLLHLLWPSSWPFFQQVICESAGPIMFAPLNRATSIALGIADSLNCKEAATQVECLRALNSNTLFEASLPFLNDLIPVVDGQSVLAQPPTLFLKQGWRPNTTVIMGNNAYEGNLFAYLANYNPNLTMSQQLYTSLLNAPNPVTNFSSEYSAWYADMAASQGYWEAYSHFFGDLIFYCTTQIFTDYLSSAGIDVYRYNFLHATQKMPFPLSILNATHFTEVPYVFSLGNGESFGFFFNEQEQKLSQSIVNYWTNFAATGNPNGGSEVEWPKYCPVTCSPPTNQKLALDLTVSTTLVSIDEQLCNLWEGILFSSSSSPSNMQQANKKLSFLTSN